MKYLLTILAFFIFETSYSQDVRVPFRVVDKFGLSNKAGELMVPAEYDQVTPIGFDFFQAKKSRIDSVKNYRGNLEAKTVNLNNVIRKDKVIISNEPYNEFRLFFFTQFIAGTSNSNLRYPDNGMLYNLKGEKLLPATASKIEFNNEKHVGELATLDANFIIVSATYLDKISIGVYDRGKEKMTKWLIESASNFQFHDQVPNKTLAEISYAKPSGEFETKYIAYNNSTKTFELIPLSKGDQASYVQGETSPYQNLKYYQQFGGIEEEMEEEMLDTDGSMSYSDATTKKRYRFKIKKDSIVLYGKDELSIPENAKLQKLSRNEYNPTIFTLENKSGIISSAVSGTKAVYDSLGYIKKFSTINKNKNEFLYVAGNEMGTDKALKFGIIDQYGKEIVPMEFDTIHNYIPSKSFKYERDLNDQFVTTIVESDREQYFQRIKKVMVLFSEHLFAVKNGQYFLINIHTRAITPLLYDRVFKNGFGSNYFPLEKKELFFIIEKDGLYGYSPTINPDQEFIDNNIKFPFLPVFYVSNYGMEKGFTLTKLVGDNGFYCYARADGFLYYRE